MRLALWFGKNISLGQTRGVVLAVEGAQNGKSFHGRMEFHI